MGSNRRVIAVFTAFVITAASLGVAALPAAAAGGGCSSAAARAPLAHVDTYAPSGNSILITQGLPTYINPALNSSQNLSTTLTRGKDTLLRLFLSLPSCAKSQSTTITGASVTITNTTNTQAGAGLIGSVASPYAPAAPLSIVMPAYYTGTPPANLSTDPRFLVPGADLTWCGTNTTCTRNQPATDAPFTAQFQIALTYTSTLGAGTETISTNAGVSKKSNALRILVAPMGNGTQTRASQYSTSADGAVQQAMNTLSRIYPVPCAANPTDQTASCISNSLLSGYGGIRYSVDPGLLDLTQISGAYDSNNKFCGSGANWAALKAALSQWLQSYNTNNPNTPADRVIGVADEAISDGITSSPSGFNCAEGMAGAGSLAAWVRATYSTTPSSTGGVLAMELEHTFGGTPQPRGSASLHSFNTAGDVLDPTRAYNITQRAQVGVPRTAMDYNTASPWNNDTVVQEFQDQQYMLCQLGGPTTNNATDTADTECTTTGATGTGQGVAAAATFVMSGSAQLGGASPSASVVESYYTTDVMQPQPPDPAAPDPSSGLRLVFFDSSGNPLSLDSAGDISEGVHYSSTDSLHTTSTGTTANEGGSSPTSVFSIAVNGPTGAVSGMKLYWCPLTVTSTCLSNPVLGGGDALYNAPKQAVGPTVNGVGFGAGQLVDYTNSPSINDANPAINGHTVAWVAPCGSCTSGATTIHVAPDSDATKVAEIALKSTGNSAQNDPSWRPNVSSAPAQQVVFDAGGSLYTDTVNTTTVPPTVGTPTLIYSQGGPNNNSPADSPTWSADGLTVYFHGSNAGVRAVSATNTKPSNGSSPVTASSSKDSAPSASPLIVNGKPDTHLAFVRQGTPDTIYETDTTDPNHTLMTVTMGDAPWFGDDGQVYFIRSGNVYRTAPDGSGLRQLSTGGSDGNPSESGGRLAFDRPATTNRDVFLANLSSTALNATATGSNPAQFKGEWDLQCPSGETFPLAVGVAPQSFSGTQAQFSSGLVSSPNCVGTATVIFRVTDGWSLSAVTQTSEQLLSVPNQPADASISAPAAGASYAATATIPLNGNGWSPQVGPLTGSHLSWYAISGSTKTFLGNGNVLDQPAPSGGWPSGGLTIELDASDGTNTATAIRTITVDGSGPAPSITGFPANPANNSGATFQFSASDADDGASQITLLCELDGGTLAPCGSPISFSHLPDGTHIFYVYAQDPAGNVSVTSYTWVIDTTAGTTQAAESPPPDAAGWNSLGISPATNGSPVTVTLTATDPGPAGSGIYGTGINHISYTLTGAQSGGGTITGTDTGNGFSGSFSVSAEGLTTVTYQSIDNAGNVENPNTLQLKIDLNVPTTTVNSPGFITFGTPVTGTATDAISSSIESGVGQVQVQYYAYPSMTAVGGPVSASLSNGSFSSCAGCGPGPQTTNWSASTASLGLLTFYVAQAWSTDDAGNVGPTVQTPPFSISL